MPPVILSAQGRRRSHAARRAGRAASDGCRPTRLGMASSAPAASHPIEGEFGAVDDDARLSGSSASPIKPLSSRIRPSINCGVPSGPIEARTRADTGMLGSILSVANTHRQQQVLRRQPVGLDLHVAIPPSPRMVACSIHGRSPASELMVSATLPAAGRFRLRLMSWNVPVLTVTLVVDSVRLPFLRPSSLKSRPSRPAAPSPSIQASRAVRSGIMPRLLGCGTGATLGDRGSWAPAPARNGGCARRCGDERLAVGAGEHGHPAVGLDPHLHLGADQAQSPGAHFSGDDVAARHADLGFGCARNDDAVGVAHDDVAHAQRGTTAGVTFKLRTADIDPVVATEIFLDGGREPWRRDIEVDRTAAKAPPQRDQSDQHHATEHGGRDRPPAPAVQRRIARKRQHVRPSSSGVGRRAASGRTPRASASRSSMSR